MKVWKREDETTLIYTQIFNEKKEKVTAEELNNPKIECRFVFTIAPVKLINLPNSKDAYFGTHLKCLQIQIREKEKISKYTECIFDDE